LKTVFEEIQGPVSEVFVDPGARFLTDPVGIYYSHPSVQAGWAMDALAHGKTWPRRLSSMDNDNQSMGILRNAWCNTLEDIGFQYDFVSYLDVLDGAIDLKARFKVIILPKTVCLSDKEARALTEFVMHSGVLIADYLCGVMDEHGRGGNVGKLDGLFGIEKDVNAGFMNGRGVTEIDAEKHRRPFLDRFTYYKGAQRYKGLVVFERGLAVNGVSGGGGVPVYPGGGKQPLVLAEQQQGKGRAVYLNLSPVEYQAAERRLGDYGARWREIVEGILKEAGLRPRVRVCEQGRPAVMIESLFWQRGNELYLGIVKNPSDRKEAGAGRDIKTEARVTGPERPIELVFDRPVGLVDMRTREELGCGEVFRVAFKPWEGKVYRVTGMPAGEGS
jgi:hypothetical protein